METQTDSMPSVIFETKGKKFSIPTTNVQSIIKLPKVTSLPNSPANVKGIIRYREKIYNIVDFRKTLSLKSVEEDLDEFRAMINQREKDHINWLLELEKSVEQNREFKLTTDPHKCAFGKWYDNFISDNYLINETLKKFDSPHQKIHNIAIRIEKLKGEEKFSEAKDIINNTRDNELSLMKELFSNFKKQITLANQELAILFHKESKRFGISVDKIISVEQVDRIDDKNLDKDMFEFDDKDFILGIAVNKNKDLIVALTDDHIY